MARASQRAVPERKVQRPPTSHLTPPEGFVLHEDEDKFALPDAAYEYQRDHRVIYQWKRLTFAGKVDHQYQALCASNRWMPVPFERHPEMGTDGAPEDTRPEGRFGPRGGERIPFADCIVRFGEILMERPIEIEDYVRDVEKDKADSQVKNQMRRVQMAPEGTLAGVNRQRHVSLTRTRDLSIPEDAE
jgi:hypothetical protein